MMMPRVFVPWRVFEKERNITIYAYGRVEKEDEEEKYGYRPHDASEKDKRLQSGKQGEQACMTSRQHIHTRGVLHDGI